MSFALTAVERKIYVMERLRAWIAHYKPRLVGDMPAGSVEEATGWMRARTPNQIERLRRVDIDLGQSLDLDD